MSSVRPLHDPAELALYGLPEGVWAWLIEPEPTELAAKGVDSSLYAVTFVGVDSWSPDTDHGEDVQYPDARPVEPAGLVKMDVRYLSVRLLGTAAQLVWFAPPALGTRLDLLNVESLKQAQIVDLFRARRLLDLDWGPPVGRPRGDTALPADEFERKLRATLAELRRLNLRPRQDVVAGEIGLNVTTLRKYLNVAGVSWRSVMRGEWPQGVSSVSSSPPSNSDSEAQRPG